MDIEGTVRLWHAHLDPESAVVRELEATLSDDERVRVERFRFAHTGRRFIVARGILRAILADRVRVEPARLRFTYGDRGKPHLAPEFHSGNVCFSVAHSQDHAMFALASREVGVDIEVLRRLPNAPRIAERFFSSREVAALRSVPESLRETAFFLGWTRKEAYIKALGEGLSALAGVEVSLAPGQPARLLNAADDQSPQMRWRLDDLSAPPAYISAVAHTGVRPSGVEEWNASSPPPDGSAFG